MKVLKPFIHQIPCYGNGYDIGNENPSHELTEEPEYNLFGHGSYHLPNSDFFGFLLGDKG